MNGRRLKGGGSWGNHGFPHLEMGKGKLPALPPELQNAARR